MQFLEDMELAEVQKIQHKCPQARFEFSNTAGFTLTIKLVLFGLKGQNQKEEL